MRRWMRGFKVDGSARLPAAVDRKSAVYTVSGSVSFSRCP